MVIKCPSCGSENSEENKFCGECGTKLVGLTEGKQPTIYEGARKQITVFFADIKGSTSLTEKLDPEEMRLLLKPVLDAMFQSVHKFGGTVIKSAGDGIMALFGAPIAFEDHALRACHAALLLQKIVKELKTPVSIRVGMNSGEVVVDVINADLRKEYDAVGPAVSIAARMEQTAEPNQIQIAPNTYKLVKDLVNVHSKGEVPIKGLSHPLEVFELLGVKREFSRFVQMRSSHLSTFVGRKEEMGILDKALDKAIQGKGQVVGVCGEPGQGKSRLIYEFMNKTKDHIQYACQSQTIFQTNPYFVIKQVIKGICDIDNNDSQDEQIEKASKKVKDPYLRHIVFDVLGFPILDASWKDMPPAYKRQEILKGIVRIILEACKENPIIFLVEDMQWIDNESIECLNLLINSMLDSKLLLLLSFRPEFKPEWKNENFTYILIKELTAENFYNLATSILGKNPQISELTAQIVERCNGNPFFLEETIRSLHDREMLGGDYGNYQLLQPLEHIVLPRTVQAVLDSRVDLLSPVQKKILKVCAAIGKVVHINLLKYVAQVEDENFDPILKVLSDKNFISKIQDFPEMIYAFSHDVILESIYSSMLKAQKRELHLAILKCLEEKFPSDDQEQLIIKAGHAFKGESWIKAFEYYLQLQIITHRKSIPVESFEYAKKVGEVFHRINNPGKDQLRSYFSSLNYRAVLFVWQGKFSEVITLFDEFDDIMNRLNDPIVTAEYYAFTKMRAYTGVGQYEEALKWSREAQKIIDEEEAKSGIKNDEIRYFINTGYMGYYYVGEFKLCIEACKNIFAYLKNPFHKDVFGSPIWSAAELYTISSYNQLGDANMSREYENKILEVSKDRKASVELYVEESALASTYCHRGDYEKSLKYIDLSLEISFQLSVFIYNTELLAMKGFILSLQHKNEEAKKYLEQSYQISNRMNFVWKASRGIGYLFEGFLAIGDMEKARFLLSKMFELAEIRKQKAIEALAWRLKGELAITEGAKEPKEIEESLRKGMEHAEKLEMLPEVARGYKAYGQLYKITGDRVKSEEAYHKSKEIYEQIGVFPDTL